MSEHTKIEWADHSWSPWRGCTKVSPGCANCYAERLSRRNPAVLGRWGEGVPRVLAKNWGDPVRWNRSASVPVAINWECRDDCGEPAKAYGHRPRVFPSLCDWLDNDVPIGWFARFLQLISETPHLDWLLLTKRPENWGRRLRAAFRVAYQDANLTGAALIIDQWWGYSRPPRNIWIGVSVEDQIRADARIPSLLNIPACVRWISLEPLIGPADLTRFLWGKDPQCERCPGDADCTHGWATRKESGDPAIDWIVIGGESGCGARPCNTEWIRSLILQCSDARVPVFVKQIGSRPVRGTDYGKTGYGGMLHPIAVQHAKGGDPAEWPEYLRLRQFPQST